MTDKSESVIPDDLSQEEFERVYGRVTPLALPEVARLFKDAPFRWWIAGGWSIELDAQPRRHHDDVEIAVARNQLPLIREFLTGYHLWDVHAGALTFLWPKVQLPDDHEQLWLRRDAHSPWLLDLLLTPVEDDIWLYKRDRRLTRPVSEVTRPGPDGIPRQRPEITLLYKARRRAPKDEDDFAAVVPTLSVEDRHWLRDAIALTEPEDNPWLRRLESN